MRIPWLHPHRADVLAAVALVVRQRQPLDRGLARLAEGDPLLRPWSERLGPALAAGEPLAAVLQRHRLIDRPAAEAFAGQPDAVAACDRLARESLAPVRGLLLIRWFPVALAAVMLVPVVVMQLSGVMGMFDQIFHDLNISLPVLTMAMLDRSWAGIFLPLVGAAAMWGLMMMLRHLRGLRHLLHLWWVEVHRQAAMLELVDAAIAGDDAPRRLSWLLLWCTEIRLPWPLKWCSPHRLLAQRQDRPVWDRSWRTWRILTRFRALGHGWREAARAPTAVGVLQALGQLRADADEQAVRRLRATVRQRLIHALEPAHVEAKALLMVGFAFGIFIAVMGLFLPLISIINQIG